MGKYVFFDNFLIINLLLQIYRTKELIENQIHEWGQIEMKYHKVISYSRLVWTVKQEDNEIRLIQKVRFTTYDNKTVIKQSWIANFKLTGAKSDGYNDHTIFIFVVC